MLLLTLLLMGPPVPRGTVIPPPPSPTAGVVVPPLLLDYERSFLVDPFTDCGSGSLDGSASRINECVIRLWEKGLPFVGRFERRGVDSYLLESLVSTGKGVLISLVYDSDVCGGGGWGPRCGERIFEFKCNGGNIDASAAGPHLKCRDGKRKR